MKARSAVIVSLAASALLSFSCYRAASTTTLSSNFSQFQLTEAGVVSTTTGERATGTLIATGNEIVTVAAHVFRGTPLARAELSDTAGLVLVLPIENGVASGIAELHVDVGAPRIASLVTGWHQFSLALAKKLSPRIKVATATFVSGKLEGDAFLYAPTDAGARKVADARFRGGNFDGLAHEYYRSSGKVRLEMTFEAGKLSGPRRAFYDNGQLEVESTHADGNVVGIVSEFYKDGSKRARTVYEAGSPGSKEMWFPDGTQQLSIVYGASEPTAKEWYSNGQLKSSRGPGIEELTPPNGLIVEYYSSGIVKSRTTYAAGVKHGVYESFYSAGGKWEAGAYASGLRDGSQKKWWKNGKLALDATWVAGKRDGRFERFYASGSPWELATFKAGKPVGHFQKWWKNGAIAHDYHFKNGKLDGKVTTFYDNGAKWGVAMYAAGKPLGTHQRWFPDGRLGFTKEHEGGKAHGEFKRWWADGTPRLDATYKKGRLDGEFKNWLEDGTVHEFSRYANGVKAKATAAPM